MCKGGLVIISKYPIAESDHTTFGDGMFSDALSGDRNSFLCDICSQRSHLRSNSSQRRSRCPRLQYALAGIATGSCTEAGRLLTSILRVSNMSQSLQPLESLR